MVDLAVSPNEVQQISGNTQTHLAAVSILQGEVVYLDNARQLQRCEADVSAVEANALGIALNGASPNQPCVVQTDGVIDLGAGASPPAGEHYCVSPNPGRIAPDADIAAGMFKTTLGLGIGSNLMKLSLNASGVASA